MRYLGEEDLVSCHPLQYIGEVSIRLRRAITWSCPAECQQQLLTRSWPLRLLLDPNNHCPADPCYCHLQWLRPACHPGSGWKPDSSSEQGSHCRPLGRGIWETLIFFFEILGAGQPGQPEQVEILPCESLLHKIGHCSLQPLTHANLSKGVPTSRCQTRAEFFFKTFSSSTVAGFSTHNMKPEKCLPDEHTTRAGGRATGIQSYSIIVMGRTNKEESCIDGPDI